MKDNVREANRRIQEAWKTGAEKLDLGDLVLSELPAGLSRLVKVRELCLGVVELDEKSEPTETAERGAPAFTDLQVLSPLQDLRSLHLADSSVWDLSPLSGLRGLRSLDLSGTSVSDLSPLAGLVNLQSLNFSASSVSDLSPLSGLLELESLTLAASSVSDLSLLPKLPGLRSLDLSAINLSDLSILSGCRGLQALRLAATGVSDLSPLAKLLGLESLDLSQTQVSDLSPLKSLRGLRSLDLTKSRVSDLSVLRSLPELRDLELAGLTVPALSPLSALPALQNLNLSGGQGVEDLSPLAGLPNLDSLDLSETALSDIGPLSALPSLRHLQLAGTGVSELSPLAGLRELQSLDLSKNPPLDLSPLLGLLRIESLDLARTRVSDLRPLRQLRGLRHLSLIVDGHSDLSPLADLPELRSLSLEGSHDVDLPSLSRLGSLETLDLSSTDVSDLSPLASLRGLRHLDLSRTEVMDLSPLSSLENLESLELYKTFLSKLSPLRGLRSLRRLGLGDTSVGKLAPLAGLRNLQSLDLWETGVRDLAPLARLHRLRSLRLGWSSVSDLTPLAGLKALKVLEFHIATQISDLSPLAALQGLQELYVTDCSRVKDLSPLAGLQSLQSLGLSGTAVSDLSPLAGLRGLAVLSVANLRRPGLTPLESLQSLQVLDVSDWGAEIPFRFVRSFAERGGLRVLMIDSAEGVPPEVVSRDPPEDCLPRLRAYFADLRWGAEADNEVKVILLGNGRVGKTQLCRRLRGEDFQESSDSTHGVQLWRHPLTVRAGAEPQTFQINWWDFGGQDIYHGTHALFLRSRAIFLILWTPHLENREEFTENGIPFRNQPLAYWLDYVRSLASPTSAVIVVQSQCDRLSDRRTLAMDASGLGYFESCYHSAKAKEEYGRETLEGLLKGAIGYLLEQSGARKIGAGRARVREELYRWRSEDQERPPEARKHRTLSIDEFRDLCERVGGIASPEHALDYFHQTGVVFHEPALFDKEIVLDQSWALDAIYAVFDRGRVLPLLRDSGRFTLEDLAALVWRERSPEERKVFLQLMQTCGICFEVGKAGGGEPRYLAPDLLPAFESIRLPAWREAPGLPALRFDYRFFHQALARQLMKAVGGRAGELAEYWKFGFWFQDGKRETQVLLQFEDTRSDREPGAGALVVRAQGADPLGLMREIGALVRSLGYGERPAESLTLGGVTVSSSALAGIVDGKVRNIDQEVVSAAPFEAFYSEREASLADLYGDPEGSALDIQPRGLNEHDKRPEVYISYAWGDESESGMIRSRAVDALYSALKKDGFAPVRDRDTLESGERISGFIRSLTRADLVVALISEKYLRSPHCLFEIYKLWQRSQAEPDLMGQCLVPVILPEVRIGSFRERAPYLRYWADEADALEPLIRDPKLRPGGQSWEEVRLVREFAHHVDDILVFLNDVLMPRNLDEHLDNGFEAVRDALRRRVAARSSSHPFAIK